MERFTIRPLRAVDLDLASGIHRSAFAPLGESAWTRQDIAEIAAAPGAIGLLVARNGKEIGFALCRVAADEAELLTIAVQADHRRLGAGRALLGAMIERIREAGATTAFLEVGADNPAACSLYEKSGFRAVGRRAGYYRRGEGRPAADALIMRLRVTSA